MPRHTVARIDLENLRHNYRRASELAGSARAMAVVKADGYGHGLARVAGALADLTERYAVACLEEAVALRESGLSHPVLLMEGVHEAEDLKLCEAEGFIVAVHDQHQLPWLESSPARPEVWLKVNSGMNRLGFAPADIAAHAMHLRRLGIRVTGAMTHFACADDPASERTLEQTRRFEAATSGIEGLSLSVANSSAHFRDGQPMFEWSRPGIMLYGSSPLLGTQGPDLGLKPVMTLESRLIAVRELAVGEAVGYGEAWRATSPTVMGMVCIGYGDGYPRHAGNGTPVRVRGTRVPLIGRVSMDMLAVDLTEIPGAAAGDPVELWGPHIGIDEVAARAGTISYELLTGVTGRVPRLVRPQS
ncbi:alanine racemase [Marinobacter daqiaonensis]|uniref:Alanine racemase n=1 Tax=Marinobacter daqiaonensis TaxID=650891 RepID=A0A1I6J5F3_9GAMM|nr:alanine racemase [Marinobacter daqiaonensis]SFR74111.1 alanine racemase [Marinobacter daqiaonensis]